LYGDTPPDIAVDVLAIRGKDGILDSSGTLGGSTDAAFGTYPCYCCLRYCKLLNPGFFFFFSRIDGARRPLCDISGGCSLRLDDPRSLKFIWETFLPMAGGSELKF